MPVFLLTLPMAGAVSAQGYPENDITHIMPWSAGGGTDTVMRTFMNFAEQQLGVGINTQNITGAQSGVGTMRLMRSRADGYTIGSLTWDSVITVPYYNLVPGYDTSDLTYIASVTIHPHRARRRGGLALPDAGRFRRRRRRSAR